MNLLPHLVIHLWCDLKIYLSPKTLLILVAIQMILKVKAKQKLNSKTG